MCNLVSFGGVVPVLLVYLVSCCKKGGKYRKLLTIKVSRECWTVRFYFIQYKGLSEKHAKLKVCVHVHKNLSSSWSSLMLKNVSVSIKSNQIGLTLKFLHLSLFPIAIRLYHKYHNIRQSLFICTHNMLGSSWIPHALNYNLSWIRMNPKSFMSLICGRRHYFPYLSWMVHLSCT